MNSLRCLGAQRAARPRPGVKGTPCAPTGSPSFDRPAMRNNDKRQLCKTFVYSVIVRTTLDVKLPSVPAVFICFRIMSS